MQELLVPDDVLKLIKKDEKDFIVTHLEQIHSIAVNLEDIELKIIVKKIYSIGKDIISKKEYSAKMATEDIILFFGAKTVVLDKNTEAYKISDSLYKVGQIMQIYFKSQEEDKNE